MIQLYFKGEWSNSCQEVPDGTMITVQSKTHDAIYEALKGMGCSHGAASFAASTNKWETAQEREKRMAKQSAPSDSEEKDETTGVKEDTDEVLDDDDEPSDWSCMSFLEKVEYIVKLKWIDDFLDNLPKRILNAILSFLFMEIMVVVWLLASLCSESWRNAVWKAIYKSVKWFNRVLDKSNIVSQ